MSTPPVSTNQQSAVPNFPTTTPIITDTEPSTPPPTPLITQPFLNTPTSEIPPHWLSQWQLDTPADMPHAASSSASSFQADSSSVTLVPRQAADASTTAVCLETLTHDVLSQIFIQLQQPRLFNTSLSNLAKTSKTMHAHFSSFIERNSAGKTYTTMRQWMRNIQLVRKRCSNEKFSANNQYLLTFADQENFAQKMKESGFKLENMAFDFSNGKHWGFQMEALCQMQNSFIKIDASLVGLSALMDEIFPALANASGSNILILDLSSNALSAGDALELLKMVDKNNNLYQINLSNNPDFAQSADETKAFFNFLFGKPRPLSHLRLNNTGFNDTCVRAICGAMQHPHLLQVIEIADHAVSDIQLQVLKKSVQKNTAQLRFFAVDKTSIYSTSAIGIMSDSIDIDWEREEQDYDDLMNQFYSTPKKSYFDPVAARFRQHPIRQLHERGHYDANSDDDEYEFGRSLPTD
ncbi:MAG: hypothetical protein RLZZ513_975 [Pseudomonadota bacterium]